MRFVAVFLQTAVFRTDKPHFFYPRCVWFRVIVSDIVQLETNFKISLTRVHEHKIAWGLVNKWSFSSMWNLLCFSHFFEIRTKFSSLNNKLSQAKIWTAYISLSLLVLCKWHTGSEDCSVFSVSVLLLFGPHGSVGHMCPTCLVLVGAQHPWADTALLTLGLVVSPTMPLERTWRTVTCPTP